MPVIYIFLIDNDWYTFSVYLVSERGAKSILNIKIFQIRLFFYNQRKNNYLNILFKNLNRNLQLIFLFSPVTVTIPWPYRFWPFPFSYRSPVNARHRSPFKDQRPSQFSVTVHRFFKSFFNNSFGKIFQKNFFSKI